MTAAFLFDSFVVATMRNPQKGEPLFDHLLALLDPPYDYVGWPELLLDLPAHTAVLEGPKPVDPPFGWEIVRAKRYGRTHVVIAQRITV